MAISNRTISRISFLLLGTALFCQPVRAEIRSDEVLQLSRKFEPAAYDYALKNSAEITPTADGRSFTLWWQPAGFDAKQGTVFVSLHGHQGWATKDFSIWHPHIKDRGYAFLGIQWWFGRSAESIGYAKPDAIYRWMRSELERRGIPHGHVIFEGFSMGAANSYAVTYLDRLQEPPYFNVTISNAGVMEPDFPPNRGFLENEGKPFAGVHWILYCSEHDEERPGSCEKMAWTKNELERRGAAVEKFIRDPVGGHGGFMKPQVHGPALDAADRIVKQGE